MIHFKCSNCGKAIKVGDSAAGKTGKCPVCGATVHVPQATAATGPPPLKRDQRTAPAHAEVPATVDPPHKAPLTDDAALTSLGDAPGVTDPPYEEPSAEVSQAESPPAASPTGTPQTDLAEPAAQLARRNVGIAVAITVLAVVVGVSAVIFVFMRSSKPSVPEIFKTQLLKFIEEGTKTCERSGQGVNYAEFREQLASVKTAYKLAKATCPPTFAEDAFADFDRAIRAWDLTLDIWKDDVDHYYDDDNWYGPFQ